MIFTTKFIYKREEKGNRTPSCSKFPSKEYLNMLRIVLTRTVHAYLTF